MTKTAVSNNSNTNRKNAPSSPSINKAVKKRQPNATPRQKKAAPTPVNPIPLMFNHDGLVLVQNIRPGKAEFKDYTSVRKLPIPLKGFQDYVSVVKTIGCAATDVNIWISTSEKPNEERLVLNVTAPEISSSNPNKGADKRKAAQIELITEDNALVTVELEFDSTYHKANPKYVLDASQLFYQPTIYLEPEASAPQIAVPALTVECYPDVIYQEDEIVLADSRSSEPSSAAPLVDDVVDPTFNPMVFLSNEGELPSSAEETQASDSLTYYYSSSSSEEESSYIIYSSEDGLSSTASSEDEFDLFSTFTAEQSTSPFLGECDTLGNPTCYGNWEAAIGI
eukprot:TRINITY_DN3527_c0_g1_i1.p1 TRINITY_DN3527_c0_g1~~TRINITY_DN3527_c0_g1_i1.p1  ORF type:complete len:338 (+),score=84.30 TRINITY_DN3527_c0_g1_i1:133-1146(+)